MRNISIRFKILFAIIAMSTSGLIAFGYLTFESYKKDKLAFVYDHLLSETQAKSSHFSSSVGNFGELLDLIISGVDFNSRTLPGNIERYLKKNVQVKSIHYHIPDKADLTHVTLLKTEGHTIAPEVLEQAPMGLLFQSVNKGEFVYKKALSRPGAWAAMVFHQKDLVDIMYATEDRFSFFLQQGNVIAKTGMPLDLPSTKVVLDSINKMQTPFGLYESMINGENYLISYSRLGIKDLIFVNMIAMKKVMLIQEIFTHQIFLFLGLMVSISLIIGTIAARWLTKNLDELTTAVKEMENEDFNYKVKVKSKDEFGILGSAFNSMTGKISDLLNELRRFNAELELMVQKRTEELQNLTNIQNAMLNSLGQGFVIINKDHKVLPVYSKIAVDMFEVVPDQVEPSNILSLKDEEASVFKELFELTFAQAMEFDDFSKLTPELRTNSKGQKIFLNYSPINSTSGELEYVLVIGTDKTLELESLEKSKRDWNFSQMVMRMARNKYSLGKVINESQSMLNTCLQLTEMSQGYPIREIQRTIHTIKGSFSYFFVDEVSRGAHELESFLESYFDSEGCPAEIKATIQEKILGLQQAIEKFIDQFDEIIQFKDSKSQKLVSLADIDWFYKYLRVKNPQLADPFHKRFYKTKIAPHFQLYPTIVNELSLKLSKNAQFVLEGADIELPENNWEEIFQQLIHVVRNSMDHGLETPYERAALGKPEQGTIQFSFAKDDDYLYIKLSDDGRGIDWEKIAAKDPSVKNEKDAIKRIALGGISSKDEVSDLSGRGVGVSSVFATTMKRGGKVNIINKKGQGIKIILTLPLSKKKHLEILKSQVA